MVAIQMKAIHGMHGHAGSSRMGAALTEHISVLVEASEHETPLNDVCDLIGFVFMGQPL